MYTHIFVAALVHPASEKLWLGDRFVGVTYSNAKYTVAILVNQNVCLCGFCGFLFAFAHIILECKCYTLS